MPSSGMWRRVDILCEPTQDLHGDTSQKTAFFIVTALKTSNLTSLIPFWHVSVFMPILILYPFCTFYHFYHICNYVNILLYHICNFVNILCTFLIIFVIL
jgi:hypothetical protein